MDQSGLTRSEKVFLVDFTGICNEVIHIRDMRNSYEISYQVYDQEAHLVCNYLKKASAFDNIHLLVALEAVIVTAELLHLKRMIKEGLIPNNPNPMVDLNEKAYAQLADLNRMLSLRLENPDTYHRYAAGTRARSIDTQFDKQGLPRDGVRSILASHATRLRNKQANAEQLSTVELDILGLRRTNFATAERAYKTLQRDWAGTASA